MKKIITLLSMGCFALGVAQHQHNGFERCSFDAKMEEFYKQNPQAAAEREALDKYLSTNDYKKTAKKTVVTIPVVVHVIYKNAQQNISDAKVLSQIQILNNDYRKLNADFNTVVPAAFKPFAADMEVNFCLATKDPNGNPTTGIVRKSVSSTFVFDDDYYVGINGGDDAWDPTKYLNIWVGAFSNTQLLGWAYGPAAAGYAFDGLCIDYRCYGNISPLYSNYNRGRTGTHEIGHYFGLNHIWGPSNSYPTICGTAGNNDGCPDTPATKEPYYGTPTYPDNSYTCVNTADGAMFMNYMDYGNDVALAMFSNDQKTRLQNTLAGPRASLLNSNACALLGLDEAEMNNSILLFPNPSVNYISIASPMVKINEVEIFGTDGRLVQRAFRKNETDKIDISKLPAGTYFVRTYMGKEFVKSLKFIKN